MIKELLRTNSSKMLESHEMSLIGCPLILFFIGTHNAEGIGQDMEKLFLFHPFYNQTKRASRTCRFSRYIG